MKKKTALQMYSLRHLTASDLPGALKKAASMGFMGVEFAGYSGIPAKELASILDGLGLEPAGSHIGFAEFTQNLERTVDFSLGLGEKYPVCPSIPREHFASRSALHKVADQFNEIGRRIREAGMVFGYHNHSFEFEPVEGECGFDILYDRLDPDCVIMELDTAWAENAGYKSLDVMRRYPRHFRMLHIKELPRTGNPHDREVIGQGLLDFPAICGMGKKMGCEWYVIEHENQQGNVEGDIAAGLRYLESVL